jgi:hypothetical protein
LENGGTLPEGTRVDVVAAAENGACAQEKPTLLSLLALAGTVDDLPADMARQHDHYIHGAPRR